MYPAVPHIRSARQDYQPCSAAERGAVIVMTAICLGAVVGIVMLAMYAGSHSIMKAKLEDASKAAVLTALQTYLQKHCQTSGVPHAERASCEAHRRIDARSAALTMLRVHLNDSSGVFGIVDSDFTPNLSLDTSAAPGTGAELHFGRFIEKDVCEGISDCHSCYTSTNAPCFEEVSINQAVPDNGSAIMVNSARIRASVNEAAAISQQIASFFGKAPEAVNGAAISAITPINAFIAFDVSRSIVGETHILLEGATAAAGGYSGPIASFHPTEFSFIINDRYPNDSLSCTNATGTPGQFVCGGNGQRFSVNRCQEQSALPSPETPYCNAATGGSFCPLQTPVGNGDEHRWGPGALVYNNFMTQSGPRTGVQHYWQDYQCVVVVSQTCRNSSTHLECMQACRNNTDWNNCLRTVAECQHPYCTPNTRHVLMDTFYDPSLPYGPRPLFSYLEGVQQIINTFEKRSVGGDALGILGFDMNSFSPRRVIALSEPGDRDFQRIKDLVSIKEQDPFIGELLESYISSGPTLNLSHLESLVDHTFFPHQWSFSNGALALLHMVDLFKNTATRQGEVKRVGIVFSDLLFNCTNQIGSAGSVDPVNPVCAGGIYSRNPAANDADRRQGYVQASREFSNAVNNYFVPHGISLYLFFEGVANPHTRVIKTSSGECAITPEDARRLGLPASGPQSFVDSSGGNQSTFEQIYAPNSTFREPNKHYADARATGGLFIPIRPPCKAGVDITANVRAACESSTTSVGVMNPSGTHTVGEFLGETSDRPMFKDGMLLCDPRGWSRDRMIKHYMEVIMNDNTARLVREG